MKSDADARAIETQGVEAWELLLRVHAALVPRLSRHVEEATGLPLSWYDVLLELNRAPGHRLHMTKLSEQVVLSRTRVSRIVDAMVGAGLVCKDTDPDDQRATFAILTPQGRTAFRRAAPVYLAGIDQFFSSHLSDAHVSAIIAGLARVLD